MAHGSKSHNDNSYLMECLECFLSFPRPHRILIGRLPLNPQSRLFPWPPSFYKGHQDVFPHGLEFGPPILFNPSIRNES